MARLSSSGTSHVALALVAVMLATPHAVSDVSARSEEWQGQTVVVSVFKPDEKNQRGEPAGAGIYISVNGIERGQTDAFGRLTLSLAVGEWEVVAMHPGVAKGEARLVVETGQTSAVDVVLTRSPYLKTPLAVIGLVGGVLPRDFTVFGLSFEGAAGRVHVTDVSEVDLMKPDSRGIEEELVQLFRIAPDYVIEAVDVPEVRRILLAQGMPAVTIRITVHDNREIVHTGTIVIRLAPPQ